MPVLESGLERSFHHVTLPMTSLMPSGRLFGSEDSSLLEVSPSYLICGLPGPFIPAGPPIVPCFFTDFLPILASRDASLPASLRNSFFGLRGTKAGRVVVRSTSHIVAGVAARRLAWRKRSARS
ncbi:hypothetical protein KC362_g40 [Hortaea werneckii]|nr:hypothetical protein KC362_g40 [Hortaea werneckii]